MRCPSPAGPGAAWRRGVALSSFERRGGYSLLLHITINIALLGPSPAGPGGEGRRFGLGILEKQQSNAARPSVGRGMVARRVMRLPAQLVTTATYRPRPLRLSRTLTEHPEHPVGATETERRTRTVRKPPDVGALLGFLG